MQLEFIKNIPAQSDCTDNLAGYLSRIFNDNKAEIDMLRLKTKLASQRFKQTKETEDWQIFAKARATLAGKISGFKKIALQTRKIHFIRSLFIANEVELKNINYTLIQFISKFLDGKELDKEQCQLIHNREYKKDKIKYAIPDDKQPVWTAFKLMYATDYKPKLIHAKVNKI